MKKEHFLLDTHTLLFWNNQVMISEDFVKFLDKQEQIGTLFISSISFWEIALLVKKKKITLKNVHAWKNELLNNTNLGLLEPSASEMIDSTLLPDFHKDPFDRLLIVQASHNGCTLVTQDQAMKLYEIKLLWM